MSTRSGKRLRSPAAPATESRNNRKTSSQKNSNSSNQVSKRARGGQQNNTLDQPQENNTLDQPDDEINRDPDSLNPALNDTENQPQFTSNFSALNFDNVEEQLEKWTLVELRNALTDQKKQNPRHKNQTPQEIKTFVELIRRDHEKRMLMAALIGGISETMVWSLVNAGPKKKDKKNCYGRFLSFGKEALKVKVPPRSDQAGWGHRNKLLSDLWNEMSPDERTIFHDPFFFALAKLPDLSLSNEDRVVELEDDVESNQNENLIAQLVSAPKIHQLSDADELKYRPIFEKLVDVEKVHSNHGKPGSTESMATMQLKSLAAFKAAHHGFATVCQRFHIHYHLTALSCNVEDGWNEVFSTDKTFSNWADENLKLSTKFKYYVHGKAVAQEIEKKQPQPVDARRGELTRELNKLLNVHMPGNIFPKSGNPYELIAAKGWPIRLNLKQPESSLLPEELALGFRDCNDALKKKWLADIQNGHFTIEKIPASELITMKKQHKKKSSNKQKSKSITMKKQHKNKSSNKQKSKSTQPAAASPVNTQEQTQNQGTSAQAESQLSRTQISDRTQLQIGESSNEKKSKTSKKSKKSKKTAKKVHLDDDESSDETESEESETEESETEESETEESEPEE